MAEPQHTSKSNLFNNPIFSDVTIRQIHEGKIKEYHAHKAVLCEHSKFSFKAFTRLFKEASDRVIEVHDDNPEQFAILLEHLYTLGYAKDAYLNKGFLEDEDEEQAWPELIGVYALADKYEVPTLKNVTAERFRKCYCLRYCYSLLANEVDPMIKAHYEKCNEGDGSMGQAIINFLFSTRDACHLKDWLNLSFGKLVKVYPVFGADMAFHAQRNKGRVWK